MINKIKLKSEFTVPQKFFADKIMEIFDNRSIDSYRARMHNPYTILEELVLVFKDLKDKKIKDFEKTVIPLINEVKALVTIDCLLNFDKINYDYLSQILNSAKSDNFIELLYSLQVLIDNNKDYISRLFESLETELQKSETNNSPLNELEKIEKTINFIATGLVSKGFSKDYLYRLSKKTKKPNKTKKSTNK